MRRKQVETLVLLGATGVTLAVAIYFFLSSNYTAAGICISVYVCLMGLEYLVSWLTLSVEHRKRPCRPAGFRGRSTGPVTAGWSRILDCSELKEAKDHRGVHYQLFFQEQEYPQGTWRFEIEVAGEKVVAWRRSFESADSLILDCCDQTGRGLFLRE